MTDGDISFMLVDDHSVVREGLRHRIEDAGIGTVVAEAANAQEALRLALLHTPDIALVDISMPGTDGIELCGQLVRERPQMRTIIFSAHTETALVQRAFDNGASGYVAKETPLEIFLQAIESVQEGRRYVDPSLAMQLFQSENLSLSGRQLEVLQLIADGHQTAAIALKLGVSNETVKSHVAASMARLHAQTRAEAVALALRQALIR